jgi:hypothetical protein
VFAGGVRSGDRILRDDATIILNRDLHSIVWHNALAELKDLQKAVRR